MALVLADRVKETTTTTGTGTYTLAGAATGFESFSVVGDGNTTYYCCTDGTNFEVGVGTYASSGTTLARTTILQSSNSDSAVNWSAGTRDIFITQPAEKAVSFDASGHINFADSVAPDYENRLRFGAGSDLQVFSDGTHGYMQGTSSNDLSIAFDEVKLLNHNYSKTRLKINSSDAVELYHDNSKKLETTADGVDIISTDDGSSIGPKLHLYRNSASPADFDDLGALYFTGNDSAGNRQEYAFIQGDTSDVSSGSEDAVIRFSANVGGSSLEHMNLSFGATQITGRLYLASNGIHSNPHILFEGSTADDHETTFNATDPTADRTITLPDATGTVQLTDGSGASLTSLNASELGSGTVPNARLDAQLQDVAGLAVTNGNFIVGDGANFVAESGSTARTSLGLGTAAVLDTGISNTNVPKFTSGVVDDDFLRVNGTDIEGRSASEVLSDIGGQASLTFGISNTNAVKIDSSSVADDEYARFTANGLESRSTSEVLSDIGGQASLTFGISNTNAVKIDSSSVADDEFARFTASGLESRSASEVRSDIGLGTAAVAATGISNGNVPVFTSGVADDDFLRVNGTSIEGRSATEVVSDLGLGDLDFGLITGSAASSQDYGAIT